MLTTDRAAATIVSQNTEPSRFDMLGHRRIWIIREIFPSLARKIERVNPPDASYLGSSGAASINGAMS